MSRVTPVPSGRPNRKITGSRLLRGAALILVLTLIMAQSGDAPPATRAREASRQAAANNLTLTSGNHALQFLPGKVILTGLEHALTIDFVGGRNPIASPDAVDAQGQPQAVIYREVWPGVDVRYDSPSSGDVESSYVVKAAGRADEIRLHYSVPVEVLSDGTLRFMFETGFLAESAPVAWQVIAGRQTPVPVWFNQLSAREISFSVGAYDARHDLVIDPRYTWHAFFGSATDDDTANDVAVDANGNVYVLATSGAAWNGPGAVLPLNPCVGTAGLVVVKLDRQGDYQWHTFYGCSSGTNGSALALDGAGDLYIVGYSSASWDGPGPTAPLHPYSGASDLFVVKLANDGAYLWHTFYGSTGGNDYGSDIIPDADGNTYISGHSSAAWDGPDAVDPLNPYAGSIDLLVLKLDSSGNYAWHAFYGTSGAFDKGFAIDLDFANNVYVAGYSSGTWNGPGPRPPLHPFAGLSDVVVLKLDTSGDYSWHTFYGSVTGNDHANRLAVDLGGAYLTGYSTLGWNGPDGDLPLNPYAGGWDILIMNLDPDGSYKWHTFYGAAGASEEGYEITLDPVGAIYIASGSSGFNGPGAAPPWNPASGKNDITMLKLSNAGSYLSHAFFGSTENDDAWAVAVDNFGSVFLAGYADATWDGPGSIPPLNAFAGIQEITVLKLWDSSAGTPLPIDGAQACPLSPVGFNLVLTDLMRTWNGSFDRYSVTLRLDDVDVTAEATVSETGSSPAVRASLLYQPTEELSVGSHIASLTYPTGAGPGVLSTAIASWTFSVATCRLRPQIMLPAPLPVFPSPPQITLPVYPVREVAR